MVHVVCPSLSFCEWCDSVSRLASFEWHEYNVKPAHQNVCQSFNSLVSNPPAPPLLLQVSLLEYRKRKQGGSRDPEPVGSSSSLGGTPTRPGSHYIQDTQHHHSHQQMYPPASSHSSFSSSAHKSISQIEEVSPPDQQGPSGQPRRQDSNNQWWEALRHLQCMSNHPRFLCFKSMCDTSVLVKLTDR